MSKKPEDPDEVDRSSEDNGLFRAAMADARPLPRSQNVHLRSPSPAPRPRMKEADDNEVMQQLLDPTPEWLDDFEDMSGESLSYRHEGVQITTLRKLRRGYYRIDDELDLHGRTVATAKQALTDFLAHCEARGLRCIRIIHGKGNRSGQRGPVLKARVDYWLRQRRDVMAFCSARPVDGGTGALLVLLKRSR